MAAGRGRGLHSQNEGPDTPVRQDAREKEATGLFKVGWVGLNRVFKRAKQGFEAGKRAFRRRQRVLRTEDQDEIEYHFV